MVLYDLCLARCICNTIILGNISMSVVFIILILCTECEISYAKKLSKSQQRSASVHKHSTTKHSHIQQSMPPKHAVPGFARTAIGHSHPQGGGHRHDQTIHRTPNHIMKQTTSISSPVSSNVRRGPSTGDRPGLQSLLVSAILGGEASLSVETEYIQALETLDRLECYVTSSDPSHASSPESSLWNITCLPCVLQGVAATTRSCQTPCNGTCHLVHARCDSIQGRHEKQGCLMDCMGRGRCWDGMYICFAEKPSQRMWIESEKRCGTFGGNILPDKSIDPAML